MIEIIQLLTSFDISIFAVDIEINSNPPLLVCFKASEVEDKNKKRVTSFFRRDSWRYLFFFYLFTFK